MLSYSVNFGHSYFVVQGSQKKSQQKYQDMPSPPTSPILKKDDRLRKINKPLMERRRRERINNCLSQLKHLVVDAMRRESTQISKLEKADILEMTVSYLKIIQHQQPAVVQEPEVRRHRYRAGFNECANQVMEFLSGENMINTDVKSRLGTHLMRCSNAVNQGNTELMDRNISPSKCYGEQLAIDIPETKKPTSGSRMNQDERLLLPVNNLHFMDRTLDSTLTCKTGVCFHNVTDTGFSDGYTNRSLAFVNSKVSNSYSSFATSGHFEPNVSVARNVHVERSDQMNNNDNVWRPW